MEGYVAKDPVCQLPGTGCIADATSDGIARSFPCGIMQPCCTIRLLSGATFAHLFPETQEDYEDRYDESVVDDAFDYVRNRFFRKRRKNACFQKCCEYPEEEEGNEPDEDERLLQQRSNILECAWQIHLHCSNV
ncbi:MAG TPA: hypothetical protein VNL69_10710 [Bacteroidota bacterium]|nr:hypothetical protein [Bacteroidota bacterium]